MRDQYGTVISRIGARMRTTHPHVRALFSPAHPQFNEVISALFRQISFAFATGLSGELFTSARRVAQRRSAAGGVRRHSVDTWVGPQWFGMDFKQVRRRICFRTWGKWERSLCEWARMRADDYGWWRKHVALSQYFDAMRTVITSWAFPHLAHFERGDAGLLGWYRPWA